MRTTGVRLVTIGPLRVELVTGLGGPICGDESAPDDSSSTYGSPPRGELDCAFLRTISRGPKIARMRMSRRTSGTEPRSPLRVPIPAGASSTPKMKRDHLTSSSRRRSRRKEQVTYFQGGRSETDTFRVHGIP